MGQNINDIQRELAQLREENVRLKELLRKHGIAYDATPPTPRLSRQEESLESTATSTCTCSDMPNDFAHFLKMHPGLSIEEAKRKFKEQQKQLSRVRLKH